MMKNTDGTPNNIPMMINIVLKVGSFEGRSNKGSMACGEAVGSMISEHVSS
jgi:hypothetical protein